MKIAFGPVICIPSSLTGTEIVCDLETKPVSGNWIVEINTASGILPNTISTEISIATSVSAINPNVEVNFLGGDILVIDGDNFGFDTKVISVTFADLTTCKVLSVDMTTIECEANRWSSGHAQDQAVTVSVNGVEDSSLAIVLTQSAESTLSMTPTSVSPVLKTEITIFLATDYTETLVKEDFSVKCYSNENLDYFRELYVMSVDEATKSIKVKFPGAPSGNYFLVLSATQGGRIQSDLLLLDVSGSVTSISPTTGSVYGGALITITGVNFSDEPLDNPVKIGDHYCFVQTSSPTEITCRTDYLLDQDTGDALLIVFLKTSEEAATESDLLFTYITPSAEVTDITTTFDEATFSHHVLVDGSNLDETVTMFIDGYAQELISWTSSLATFKVTNMDFASTDDVQVFTDQGYPSGSDIAHTLEFIPSILAITPSAGSSAGTWITVEGTGFGALTEGLNLQVNGADICSEVSISTYGVFNCLTNAAVIDGTSFGLSISSVAQSSYVASDVAFSQSEIISVSSATLAGNTITFVGTGFPTDGTFVGFASFGGIETSSVTIVSSTEVIATWAATGVASGSEQPVLYFEETTDLY